MKLRNLHRLWLGRGTHCRHLVCNLKEETQSQYNLRKKKKKIPQLSCGIQASRRNHTRNARENPAHVAHRAGGPARAQQPRPGASRSHIIGPICTGNMGVSITARIQKAPNMSTPGSVVAKTTGMTDHCSKLNTEKSSLKLTGPSEILPLDLHPPH